MLLSLVFLLLMFASASLEAYWHHWIGLLIFLAFALWDFYMLLTELVDKQ